MERERGMWAIGVRAKMVLVLLVVLSVSLGSTGWLAFKEEEEAIERETEQRGRDLVRVLSNALQGSVIGYDYQAIEMFLNELVGTHDVVAARVVSRKGNVMAEVTRPGGSKAAGKPFRGDIVFDGKKIGEMHIELDNGRIISELKDRRNTLLGREALLVLLAALGELVALSFIIVRPLRIISNAISRGDGEQDLLPRDIPITSSDELGELAGRFNKMRRELARAQEKLEAKVELADSRLRETNAQLVRQSDALKQANEELHQLSVTDALTGLRNRRHFETMLEEELERARRYGDENSLLVIDIDHFKSVNDTHGHDGGDRVLKEIARVLVARLRKTDFICRFGGEEFVVLCQRTTNAEAMGIAEALRAQVASTPVRLGAQDIFVTVSIGVAAAPAVTEEAVAAADLFRHADTALYRSKRNGRDRVTHYDDIRGDHDVESAA